MARDADDIRFGREEPEGRPFRIGVQAMAREARASSKELESTEGSPDLLGIAVKLQENLKRQEQLSQDIGEALQHLQGQIRELREGVEDVRKGARTTDEAARQAALDGVNRAQEQAEKMTLERIEKMTEDSRETISSAIKSIEEVAKSSREYIEKATEESRKRIERLARVTLPDKLFQMCIWMVVVLLLFILSHVVWQLFMS